MAQSLDKDHIAIIDFGSQVTQLIARLVRGLGVYCVITPYDSIEDAIKAKGVKALILSGSPASLTQKDAPLLPIRIFASNLPILGICYGMQVMGVALGGRAEKTEKREYGAAEIELIAPSPLWDKIGAIGSRHKIWMSHGDELTHLPQGFTTIAQSANAPNAAIADEKRGLYGVQFHPEVVHTPSGRQLIDNFITQIVNIKREWTSEHILDRLTQNIKAQIGDKKVICALSGGVDSAVAACLVHRAVGAQLSCIFVDNGLLRHQEAKEVADLFSAHFNIPLTQIDAEDRFLAGLKGVSDPEAKRKIIGHIFIDIFEEQAKIIGDVEFLVQGTLYPDVIESVSVSGAPSQMIKSHHNVGGLPERMNIKLVEPLRDLFKDEVRDLGRQLGLPNAFINRHPFPGPGLAIRVLGAVQKSDCDLLRQVDKIYLDEIRRANLYDEIWQAFAIILPLRSVGVMGDGRAYDRVCALRAICSQDGMTASVYHFHPDFLNQCAARIVNEVEGIGRVVYDISSKPPASIEWE